MAKSWSKKSKYKSNYGGGYVTPAQYLIECLCVLIAKRDKIQLPDKFWKEPVWAQIFQYQSKHIKTLLKTYPHPVILDTLRDRRCWKLRSFGAKWLLIPILKAKLKVFDAKETTHATMILTKPKVDQPPRKPMGKKTALTRLKELDG